MRTNESALRKYALRATRTDHTCGGDAKSHRERYVTERRARRMRPRNMGADLSLRVEEH